MKICKLEIKNFRGISHAEIFFPNHAVLVGDNNTGKTTLLEAIDLVLGPDRLNRRPPIDEHDFYQGEYLAKTADVEVPGIDDAVQVEAHDVEKPQIFIEVTIIDLNVEQQARFGDYIEFWDKNKNALYDRPNPEGVDEASIAEALRVSFVGAYDQEEDDFEGKTFFARSLEESDSPTSFSKRDKQSCGFLYLRSLRTGSRALSLERGSLLDIILRLKEVRPQMWESTLAKLDSFSVATDPELGISEVLESINSALKKYVPKEWGIEPHLKVSNLTRDHLRKVITAFIATGDGDHAAPFYRQGTGTINMLVLAMLSQIAQDKQNVIFAMEEPETAIPPYAQKRIVHEIRQLSSQTLFTSHSPYVLEEFEMDETIVLMRDAASNLHQSPIQLPDSVKLKRYRQEFRTRFCEGLLSRRVLIAEGATEAAAIPVACRRLAELNAKQYASLEAMGVCTIDAGTDSQVADLGRLYRDLGKQTFAVCDKQDGEQKNLIEANVDQLYMHDENGFERLILNNTTENRMKEFIKMLEFPPHLLKLYPKPEDNPYDVLYEYFKAKKGEGAVADYLASCDENDIPEWLRDVCTSMKRLSEGQPLDDEAPVENDKEAPATEV